jgi:hypothetical protein
MDEGVRLQGSLQPDPAPLGVRVGCVVFCELCGVEPSFAEEALGRMGFRAVRDG